MSKVNVAEIAVKLFDLLQPLEQPDRQKVIQAALVLLGEPTLPPPPLLGSGGHGGPPTPIQSPAISAANNADVHKFFAEKDPHNKIEEFAVAARYRELHEGASTHSNNHLKVLITKGARRNFDENNFARDLNNARTKGLFNKGADEKGEFTLAYYGQQYVDALPDRAKVKSLRKPKNSSRKSATKSRPEKKQLAK